MRTPEMGKAARMVHTINRICVNEKCTSSQPSYTKVPKMGTQSTTIAPPNARINVTDTVQNLTAIAQQNAASTQQSSASVNQVNDIIQNMALDAKQLQDIANNMNQSINIFKC